MSDTHLPVTVLSELLDAGKTTPLNRVLSNREGRRLAVNANDMSEIKLGADLAQANTELCRTDKPHVEITTSPDILPNCTTPFPRWCRAGKAP